jgi:hypothetical protein
VAAHIRMIRLERGVIFPQLFGLTKQPGVFFHQRFVSHDVYVTPY